MSESTARIETLVGSLWTHMEQAQHALREKLGELDPIRVSPALFTMFANTADGMLKLSDSEGESLWYSFVEVADTLLKSGQITRAQCAEMSACMDETSEFIIQECERELVESERKNPLAAILNGTARALELDQELFRDEVGPILAEFISEADQLPADDRE